MKKTLYSVFEIFLGALLVAISISMFIVPHGFISGGVSGIALIIFYKTGIPVSLLLYIFNIPVVALGAKHVGKKFAMYSVAGITMMSSFIFFFRAHPLNFPSLTNNTLLAAVFAGVMTGLGGGLVFKSGGTLGGTDILAVMAKKRYDVSIGSFLFYSNVVIMVLSLMLFPPEIIMYTLVSMFTASRVTDKVQEGINTKTTVIIISDFYECIAENIMKKMRRGITYLNGEGAFLHKEKKIIMCVITRFELSKLKNITIALDKNAFISVSETQEVLGRGF